MMDALPRSVALRLLGVFLILLVSLGPAVRFMAYAQESGRDVPGWSKGLDQGVESIEEHNAMLKGGISGVNSLHTNASFQAALEKIPNSGELDDFQRLQKAVEKNSKYIELAHHAEEFLDGFLAGLKIGNDLNNHEYKKLTQDALEFGLQFAVDAAVKAAVAVICAATTGPGAIVCFLAVNAALGYVTGKLTKAFAEWAGGAIYCRFRSQDPDCSEEGGGKGTATASGAPPGIGAPAGIGAPGGIGAPANAGYKAASSTAVSGVSPSPRSNSGGRGGGGVSVGSSSLHVAAHDITTSASNGGSATTSIGSISSGGGGSANVVANDIVTQGNGKSATTAIAPGGGSVVTTGPIVNEGGNLTMGGGGTISRNGQLCVDVYLTRCVTSMYPKPAHHPCAPTYVYKPMTNMCEHLSDDQHSILGRSPF